MMRILSLFDGISCGRLALQRAEIDVDFYFASEIDKFAIKVAKSNFPDIIEIGDVNDVNFKDFVGGIDLLMGGSPCQNLSICGNREGLEGDKSSLFFKFVEALNIIKPKYFLLENNASMSKSNRDIITHCLGVEPVLINSALVSAQNRKRLYWCNWKIPEIKDRGIKLQDIIEDGYVDREKSLCLRRKYCAATGSTSYLCRRYFDKSMDQLVFSSKETRDELYEMWRKNPYFERDKIGLRTLSCVECERLQTLPDGYTACVSDWQRKASVGNGWTVDVIAEILRGLLK